MSAGIIKTVLNTVLQTVLQPVLGGAVAPPTPPPSGPVVTAFISPLLSDTVNKAVFPFNAADIGVAASDRIVHVDVMVGGGGAGTITGVTADAVAMTELVKPAIDGETQCAQYNLEIPLGTDADIEVTCSASKGHCTIAITTVTAAVTVPFDTASDTADTTPDMTINVEADGAVIATAIGVSGSNPTSAVWTGVNEEYDNATEANVVATGGSEDLSSAQTGRPVSVAFNVLPADATSAATSYEPSNP